MAAKWLLFCALLLNSFNIIAPGVITTIVGTGTGSYSGDGASATSATLLGPRGIVVDTTGNVYIADEANHRIRKATISTGIISTIAGTGTASYSGDGSQATSANLNTPTGVVVDSSGNVYIADYGNSHHHFCGYWHF